MAIINELHEKGANLEPSGFSLSEDKSEYLMVFTVYCLSRIDSVCDLQATDNLQGAVLFQGQVSLSQTDLTLLYAQKRMQEGFKNYDLFSQYENWIKTLGDKNHEIKQAEIEKRKALDKVFTTIAKSARPAKIKRRTPTPRPNNKLT